MKNILFILFSFLLLSCGSTAEKAQLEVGVEGMSCSHSCAPYIQKNLSKLEGAENVVVDFETKTAKLIIDNKNLTQADVVTAIENLLDGQYKVTSVTETVIENSTKTIQKSEQGDPNFDITDHNVTTSTFKLPNIFKVLEAFLN